MKIPLLSGRALNRHDTFTSPKVAIISETMARTYFPGISPIGRTFSIGDSPEWHHVEVVGVCRDAKFYSLKHSPMPAAFYPHSQHGMFLYNLVAHYSGDPKAVIPKIRKAIHSIDPNLPVGTAITIERQINDSLLNRRLVAQLSLLFGLLAAFLSCVGIYGVVSYGTARRTNEFGIRMALGAERPSVLWMVILEASRLILVGVVFGLLFTIASGRLIQTQLFGLSAYDPLSLGSALAAMVVVALIAAWIPARRATQIDPVVALRYE
jgi:predicted permease